MVINIPETVKENIFKYRFTKYLTAQNLPVGGNADAVISRIEGHTNSTERQNLFLHFLKDELKYGKNKRIYYTQLLLSSVTFLRSLNNVEQALRARNINITSFNNLLKENPTDNEVLYLNISCNTVNQVEVVEFCIFKEIEPSENLDSATNLTNYVWVELNTVERSLIVRVRPHPLPSMKKGFSTTSLYNEVLEQLFSIFNILIVDSIEFSKSTFYKMYKEFIVSAELPYRNTIEDMGSAILESQGPILEGLGIECGSELGEQIITRYKRLLERMLIINDMENYNSYHEARIAVVERISITDDTGANANVLSGDEDGLDVTKIYFDIRETIDEIQKLDKVWIMWFHEAEEEEAEYEEETEEDVEQIEMFSTEVMAELEENHTNENQPQIKPYSTRFVCFKKHVEISFLTKQSVKKEVQDHVLSHFKAFERQR